MMPAQQPSMCPSTARPRPAPSASRPAARARGALVAVLAGVLLVGPGLGGCRATDPTAEPEVLADTPSADPFEAEGYTLGVANYSLVTTYLSAVNETIEDRATETGMNVVSTDAGGDAAQLAADVEGLLAEGVDGIIVSAGDLVNAPAVSLAMRDSQVSLVFVGRAFDSGAYNAQIGPDYSSIGWDTCDYLGSSLGGRGKVAMIAGGPANHPIGRLLSDGAEECFEQTYPEMSVVHPGAFGDWTEDGGRAVMSSLLAEHGDVVAVFCHNDEMCLGAQSAAAEAGRADEMVFVGVGGTDRAFQAVMDGTNFNATSLLDPTALGEQGVNLMASIFRREDFARNSYVPAPLVRPENAAEYYDASRDL